MSYRLYTPPTPLLFGYDPVRDLPPDHLARLVEQVVEASVTPPRRRWRPGQTDLDPRPPGGGAPASPLLTLACRSKSWFMATRPACVPPASWSGCVTRACRICS